MKKIALTISTALFLYSCGSDETRSNMETLNTTQESPMNEAAVATSLTSQTQGYLETKGYDAYLKKTLDTNVWDESGRGTEFCTLYKNSRYLLESLPEDLSDHLRVTIRDYDRKGCSFKKGYVKRIDIKRVSSDPNGTEEFPIAHKPYYSYKTGIRRFGAARSGGRLHAAADLYSSVGQPVFAIADGVITDFYYFYSGTYAVVVDHTLSGNRRRIVRYGEIRSLSPSVYVGKKVRKGELIATIGKLQCCHPMLHFEYFSGSINGPLTVSTGRYRRRSDLLNPNQLLDTLSQTAGF